MVWRLALCGGLLCLWPSVTSAKFIERSMSVRNQTRAAYAVSGVAFVICPRRQTAEVGLEEIRDEPQGSGTVVAVWVSEACE